LLIIYTHQDPRIALSVRSRKAHRRPHLGATATHIDLRTAHVELHAPALGRGVQCDDFSAQQVLAGRDARRHGEVDPAPGVDHAVDAPGSGRLVKAVFVDFEPFLGGRGGGGGVVYFGPIVAVSISHL
jgi:hypothetical protein